MPTMPKGLTPLVANYSVDDPGGVIRTEVAGGAPRYGLAWDRGPQRFAVTLLLSDAQFSVWTAFYHHVVRKGAVSFDMKLDSGFGPHLHTVNIVPGSYSYTRSSGVTTSVAFTVEAESQVYQMTSDDALTLISLYEAYVGRTDATLARIALFANIESDVLDFA
jgi:hypothetical protein